MNHNKAVIFDLDDTLYPENKYIKKVYSQEEIEILFSRFYNLMIQEYINGQEIGADVYIDLISNEPVASHNEPP